MARKSRFSRNLHARIQIRLRHFLDFASFFFLVQQAFLVITEVSPKSFRVHGDELTVRMRTFHRRLEQRGMLGYHVVLQAGRLDGVVLAVLIGTFVLAFVGLLMEFFVLRHDTWVSGSETAVGLWAGKGFGVLIRRKMLPQVDLKAKENLRFSPSPQRLETHIKCRLPRELFGANAANERLQLVVNSFHMLRESF